MVQQQPTSSRVAVCIAGAARGFSTPLVLQLLRRNFVEALGAEPRLFLHLKAGDTPKVDKYFFNRFEKPNETSVGSILAALKLPWITRLAEEVVVVNGSGSFVGGGHEAGEGQCLVRIVRGNGTMWRRYAQVRCDGTRHQPRSTCCVAPSRDGADEHLLLLHLSLAWCRGAILRAEARSGTLFDLVAYTRPDVIWWAPPPAWSAWSVQRAVLTSARVQNPGSDQAWVAAREFAPQLLSQAKLHRDCTTSISAQVGCCTHSSERTLSYSLLSSKAGGPLPPIEDIKWNISLLRLTKGACDPGIRSSLRDLETTFMKPRLQAHFERRGGQPACERAVTLLPGAAVEASSCVSLEACSSFRCL